MAAMTSSRLLAVLNVLSEYALRAPSGVLDFASDFRQTQHVNFRGLVKTVLKAAAYFLPVAAFAQDVISAKAGMINHIEGRVLLQDERLIEVRPSFLHLEAGHRLRTEDGRAEVLFAVGSYLHFASPRDEKCRLEVDGATVALKASSAQSTSTTFKQTEVSSGTRNGQASSLRQRRRSTRGRISTTKHFSPYPTVAASMRNFLSLGILNEGDSPLSLIIPLH